MPPRKAAKKAPAKGRGKATTAAVRMAKEAEREALVEWIARNDPLLDEAPTNPIRAEELFTAIVTRRAFSQPGVGQVPYDWSAFRTVLEGRHAGSPRWFVQLREEDLLAGDDGMEGVVVNCFVIAEATEPTLSPAEYVVKAHWPYSDAEDNAPERILPIAGQGMCWRRVVRNDGADINMYLLQKREDGVSAPSAVTASSTSAASFGFGAAPAASTVTATPMGASSFGFGTSTTNGKVNEEATTTTAGPTPSFGFGFGHEQQRQLPPASGPSAFGFASSAPASSATTAAPGFSFGTGVSSPAAAAVAPANFSFGFGSTPVSGGAPLTVSTTVAPDGRDDGAITVQTLKTSEVLFCLWSKKRLTAMAQEVRSGSRIVREKFILDATTSIKLVMENDRQDKVSATVRRLILSRLFAKTDESILEVDRWMEACPVYDEQLTTALQQFREQYVNEVAGESEEFERLFSQFHEKMEVELQRIVNLRERAAQRELDTIADILVRMKEHKLADRASFRLLKYYAKNDVQRFRPFGKVSGISEMGEAVDVCEPPAHVNINPFTGLAS